MNSYTGGPRYMRSFYLRFRISAISHICDPEMTFFWNISSNYQSSLIFLCANSLYASLFLESLSLAYNEVQLYISLSCLKRIVQTFCKYILSHPIILK